VETICNDIGKIKRFDECYHVHLVSTDIIERVMDVDGFFCSASENLFQYHRMAWGCFVVFMII